MNTSISTGKNDKREFVWQKHGRTKTTPHILSHQCKKNDELLWWLLWINVPHVPQEFWAQTIWPFQQVVHHVWHGKLSHKLMNHHFLWEVLLDQHGSTFFCSRHIWIHGHPLTVGLQQLDLSAAQIAKTWGISSMDKLLIWVSPRNPESPGCRRRESGGHLSSLCGRAVISLGWTGNAIVLDKSSIVSWYLEYHRCLLRGFIESQNMGSMKFQFSYCSVCYQGSTPGRSATLANTAIVLFVYMIEHGNCAFFELSSWQTNIPSVLICLRLFVLDVLSCTRPSNSRNSTESGRISHAKWNTQHALAAGTIPYQLIMFAEPTNAFVVCEHLEWILFKNIKITQFPLLSMLLLELPRSNNFEQLHKPQCIMQLIRGFVFGKMVAKQNQPDKPCAYPRTASKVLYQLRTRLRLSDGHLEIHGCINVWIWSNSDQKWFDINITFIQ